MFDQRDRRPPSASIPSQRLRCTGKRRHVSRAKSLNPQGTEPLCSKGGDDLPGLCNKRSGKAVKFDWIQGHFLGGRSAREQDEAGEEAAGADGDEQREELSVQKSPQEPQAVEAEASRGLEEWKGRGERPLTSEVSQGQDRHAGREGLSGLAVSEGGGGPSSPELANTASRRRGHGRGGKSERGDRGEGNAAPLSNGPTTAEDLPAGSPSGVRCLVDQCGSFFLPVKPQAAREGGGRVDGRWDAPALRDAPATLEVSAFNGAPSAACPATRELYNSVCLGSRRGELRLMAPPEEPKHLDPPPSSLPAQDRPSSPPPQGSSADGRGEPPWLRVPVELEGLMLRQLVVHTNGRKCSVIVATVSSESTIPLRCLGMRRAK